MWERRIDGRELTFRLAGINNQNFLMRDEETGSYWQQISGAAISGPYRGRQLELVHSDELTFGTWRAENSDGTVLAPVGEYASEYETKDWDVRMRKTRTVVDTKDTAYAPRELMLGIDLNGDARAYILENVLQQKLIQDWVGGIPVIVVVGPDSKSVRVFEARVEGHVEASDFYRNIDGPALFTDSVTGSGWNFQGCGVSGPAVGKCLKALPALKDYWFDWHRYHPQATVHTD